MLAVATFIATSPDWRSAATSLVDGLVANRRCFSSGEIAAILRTFRPDFRFAVANVGELLREKYAQGEFPSYEDDSGDEVYPTQVPRVTNGEAQTVDGRRVTSRTPPGTTVFVYAPEQAEAETHPFEVFIPEPKDPSALLVATIPASVPVPVAPVITAITITGKLAKGDLDATVNGFRLYIPKAAFEAWVALTGQALRGGPNGDSVHVEFGVSASGGDEVRVTRTPTSTSTPYHLWATRGRVAIFNQTGKPAFVNGDAYRITVSVSAMVIDLSVKV